MPGTFLLWSQNKRGAQIIAKNMASKSGTTKAAAVFIPATRITKAARFTKLLFRTTDEFITKLPSCQGYWD